MPPQSEEVNPDPGGGVGLVGEVASSGSFLPVQAVITMPLPRLADASPVMGAGGGAGGRVGSPHPDRSCPCRP